MIPAAVYLRVSTEEQTIEAQRPDCMRLCEARGLDVTGRIYEEIQSTTKRRPVFDQMMVDAKRGHFKVLVFWSLDRFGRTMFSTIGDIKELDRVGVEVVSVRESWFDTTGPVRDLLICVFAWVANHERERLRERTIAGMARARAEGKQIGGIRTIPDGAWSQAYELRKTGLSWAEIAKQIRKPNGDPISPASAFRLCREYAERHNLPPFMKVQKRPIVRIQDTRSRLKMASMRLPDWEQHPGALNVHGLAPNDCGHGRDMDDDCNDCGRCVKETA